MSKIHASTQFINVMVEVKQDPETGKYHVHTAPEVPCITQKDTVINYQIYDTNGEDIIFTGMSVIPVDNDQLSLASVSTSGKQLTFTDANTKKITLNITLNFKTASGISFMHDPQVQNEPQV